MSKIAAVEYVGHFMDHLYMKMHTGGTEALADQCWNDATPVLKNSRIISLQSV